MARTYLLPLAAALLATTTATSYDCAKIVASSQTYDLSPLSGARSISLVTPMPPSVHNTTYTLNICGPLKRHSSIPAYDDCPTGTRVCITKRIKNSEDKTEVVSKVITVAGDFIHDGRDLDSHFMKLKDVERDDEGRAGDEDAGKEGLRMRLNGGLYPLDAKVRQGRKQSAVVDFVCDQGRSGLEGLDHDEGDVEMMKAEPSLQLISYGVNPQQEAEDLLRLRWLTRLACDEPKGKPEKGKDPDKSEPEDGDGDEEGEPGGHGFFFWLFVVVLPVLLVTYVLFSCYLNYQRNGASGLELLPHSDTIQDLPYLARDWLRRVISSFQGGGSRGRYSSV